MHDSDLPEGVIDDAPAGGWESGNTADGETAEQSADAAGSPELTDAGSSAHRALDTDEDVESTEPAQGADPDLSTDEEA